MDEVRRRPIGFALLGAGAGATIHAEALSSCAAVRLAAVADPDLARARELADRYGGVALDDPESALARDDVEAACVVVPNHLHAPLATSAARRGVAVLLEKPLARNPAEAGIIVATCAAHGVALGVVLQNRFAAGARALRAAVREGRLGRLVGASVLVRCDRGPDYFRGGPWRRRAELAGGGALLIQGIHFLDLLDWIAGPVVAVMARAETRKHEVEVEDILTATLELRDGALAALLATTAAMPESPARLELFGTEGSAVLLEARGAVRLWWGGEPQRLPELVRLEHEMAMRLAVPWPSGTSAELHRALVADFAESLGTDRAPAVDGRAGLRLQEVVQAIYTAARSGTRVALLPGPITSSALSASDELC